MLDVAEVFAGLNASGWRVELVQGERERPLLPTTLLERYGPLPEDYTSFLSGVRSCANSDETAWFLNPADFWGEGDSAHRWNELEIQTLEAAEDDENWSVEVRSFWDEHLPILLSVKTGYAYLALRLARSGARGQVVLGRSPEYETTTTVADSFAELCVLLLDWARADEREGVFSGTL